MKPRNIILYGPPGTGKTYRTTALAVQLIEDLTPTDFSQKYAKTHRSQLRRQQEQYRQEGRLAFVVFHASFSYEDLVEGIKPQTNERQELRYAVEDGIFKQMCVRAAHALYLAQQKNTLASTTTDRRSFDALFFEFVDYLKRSLADDTQETVFESKTGKPFYLVDINQNNTLSLRMGRGRQTYPISKANLEKLYRTFASADEIKSLRRDMPASVRRVSSVAWATFHRLKQYEATRTQTYQYLLEGKETYDQVRYQAMKRDVQQLDYDQLSADDYGQAGNFVLVVDEINRGNVAAIFGELIALIEDDKRGGQPEMLQTTLPYSRETLIIPPNLFLVGTMNTADRSVEALDTALRRRFSFEAMYPDPTLLHPVDVTVASDTTDTSLNVAAEPHETYSSSSTEQRTVYSIDLPKLLTAINQRLTALLDADHQIGHGYLMPVLATQEPLAALRHVVHQKIIPLLQEYFFNETEKVLSVIGKDFFTRVDVPEESTAFFAEEAAWIDPPQKVTYRLRSLTDREFVHALINVYDYS